MISEKLSLMDMFLNKQVSGASIGKIVPAQNVLVLAPHQDDEVLGCGGTILKYLEQKAKVTVVYLTDGRYGIKTEQADIRKNEAIIAWSDYSEVSQIFCCHTDSRLSECEKEVIEFLRKTLEALKPDIVFTPWIMDRHSDHTYTSSFLAASLRVSGLHECIIASYEVAFPLFANHTVNVTKQWDKKLELLDAYKSQENLNIKQFITSLNRYRAQLTRLRSVKVAESFYLADIETFKYFVELISVNKEASDRSI